MRIKEVTFQHRNDFHYIAECRFCGKDSKHTDGYADNFYCSQVVPRRHCPHCRADESGATDLPKQCACGAPLSNVVVLCDKDTEGRAWCPECFQKTDCGRGKHGEGCATTVISGPEAQAEKASA